MGYGGTSASIELADLCGKLVSLEQEICKKPDLFLCRLHGAVRARIDALECRTADLRALKGTLHLVADSCVRAEMMAYIQTVESGRADNGIPPIPIHGPGQPVDEGFPGLPPAPPPPGQPLPTEAVSAAAITPEALLNARIDYVEQKVFELRKGAALARGGGGGGGSAEVRIVENVTPLIGGTNGRVLFNDGGTIGEDDAFLWDETNNRLTVDQLALVDDNGILLTNQTDAAAAGAGTLTNAPIAGDPTWIRVVRNGVNGAIPWWRIP